MLTTHVATTNHHPKKKLSSNSWATLLKSDSVRLGVKCVAILTKHYLPQSRPIHQEVLSNTLFNFVPVLPSSSAVDRLCGGHELKMYFVGVSWEGWGFGVLLRVCTGRLGLRYSRSRELLARRRGALGYTYGDYPPRSDRGLAVPVRCSISRRALIRLSSRE